MAAGGGQGPVLTTDFVVVGQRPQFDTIGGGALCQNFWRQGAVGDDGMAMQVSVKYGHAPILGWCKAIVRAQGLFLWSVALP